jgi:feruloyl esterase
LGCNFNAETLLCSSETVNATDEAECLTAEQLQTFDTITRDFVEANSTLVFPAWFRGSEHFWDLNIDGGAPNIIGWGYIQYMMGLGPDWKWESFDEDIVSLSEQLDPGQADASDYDLRDFYEAGRKLIHYHGMSDGGIATGASYYLYDQINRAVTPQGIEMDDFYRFFPIPGMGYVTFCVPCSLSFYQPFAKCATNRHCVDTADYVNAPYYIAGISMTNNGQHSVPGFQDANHDVLLALMSWVENGTAPDAIIGTAYSNFTTMDEITRQRPICAHPKLAKYQGSGDPRSPESWECELLY